MEDKKDIKMNTERKSEGLSRRDFLKVTGLAGLGLALGLRPRRVEAQESPLHLDAIEVADLSPDGGRPKFQRFESKTQDSSDLLSNPNFSKISQSVQDAVKTATAIFKQKNIQVQGGGITAVVQGVKKEIPGKEPTVTPTAPIGDKDVPVLISVAGSGILVDNDKAWFYGNGEIFQAIGVTQNKDIPANLYVFPRGNTLSAADNKNGGIVYVEGATNDKGGIEWTKVTAPEKSEWDLNSDKAPVLSAGIVEVIRDGKEKAVMIPDTAIAVSMAGMSQAYWDHADKEVKDKLPQFSGPDDLIIFPVKGRTDEVLKTTFTNFVKVQQRNGTDLEAVDNKGQITKISPKELNPQLAVLFFDQGQFLDVTATFFKNEFEMDISSEDLNKIYKSKAYLQDKFADMLRLYNPQTNIEYMFVFIPKDDPFSAFITYRLIDAVKAANSKVVEGHTIGTPEAMAFSKQFEITCGGRRILGVVGSTNEVKMISQLVDKSCLTQP